VNNVPGSATGDSAPVRMFVEIKQCAWRLSVARTIFGMNQVVTHGFGLFLFAALEPLMRESMVISHWHLAMIGVLTQLACLEAMLLILIGHRLGTGTMALTIGRSQPYSVIASSSRLSGLTSTLSGSTCLTITICIN
jgi:hypothetical protein